MARKRRTSQRRAFDPRASHLSLSDHAIEVCDLAKNGSPLATVVKDKRLRWPDTFAEGPDGTIYVTTSRIQDSAFYKPTAPGALPNALWSFKPQP